MIAVLTKIQSVRQASRYSTGWDIGIQRFRVMNAEGILEPKFVTRLLAEKYALSIARMVFAKQDKEYMMQRARAILPGDVLHEIGEENIFDGPLYERVEESSEENLD